MAFAKGRALIPGFDRGAQPRPYQARGIEDDNAQQGVRHGHSKSTKNATWRGL